MVAAVHLPVGDCAGRRQRILEGAVRQCDERKEGLLVVGDMNAEDDEMRGVCQEVKLQEARYAGASWGVKGNKFYADMSYAGFGLQKDRVLFGSRVWAEALSLIHI